MEYFETASPSYEDLVAGGAPGSPPAGEAGGLADRVLPLLRAGIVALRACPALQRVWRAGPLFHLLLAGDSSVRWTAAHLIGLLSGLVASPPCALRLLPFDPFSNIYLPWNEKGSYHVFMGYSLIGFPPSELRYSPSLLL